MEIMSKPDGDGVLCAITCDNYGVCDVYHDGKRLVVDFGDVEKRNHIVDYEALFQALVRAREKLGVAK
ncbi:MAG: hypothetical protein IPG74_15445 [Flavobacteriales bacterium]|nr:hypothetical protein [Flavobacteriales bacterium]